MTMNSWGCSAKSVCCQSGKTSYPYFVTGTESTPIGNIPVISTEWGKEEQVGSWKARWGINRMQYDITVKEGVGCAAAVIAGKLRGTEPACGCGGDETVSCCG